MRIWREATERGGGGRAPIFPNKSSSLIYYSKKIINLPSLALAPRPRGRAPGLAARCSAPVRPPVAAARAHTACASGRHPSLPH